MSLVCRWLEVNALASATAERTAYSRALDRFIEAYPDESCGWYSRGVLRVHTKDIFGAREDFSRGNAAPSNRLPCPFPFSFILERRPLAVHTDYFGEPLPQLGSEVAAGLAVGRNPQALHLLTGAALVTDEEWARGALDQLPEADKLEAIGTFHAGLIRICQMPGSGLSLIHAACSADLVLLAAAIASARQLAPSQIDSLLLIRDMVGYSIDQSNYEAYYPFDYTYTRESSLNQARREIEAQGADLRSVVDQLYFTGSALPTTAYGPQLGITKQEWLKRRAEDARAALPRDWRLTIHGALERHALREFLAHAAGVRVRNEGGLDVASRLEWTTFVFADEQADGIAPL